MKRLSQIILAISLVSIFSLMGTVFAGDDTGRRIFKERGCAACHHPTEDQMRLGLGPSLEQVAQAYKDHEGDISKFLRCENGPIVDKTKFPIMHDQVVSLKSLSDAELEALAKFISDEWKSLVDKADSDEGKKTE